jgi:hypothetical protein
MSNSLAIAAVTATLRNLLLRGVHADSELSDATVTTQPIDKARNNNNANQINLFLYLTSQDPAFRNTSVSRYGQPAELGYPPLALDLYYLVTAYGRDNDDVLGHRLLGKAMSILHDHPVLGADEIRNALAGNDLYEQVERIRISPQPMTVDEASKLWMVFQTQYRISVAYRADIVLIDSNRPVRSPLPVLTIGEEDKGPAVIAGLLPTFNGIMFPNKKLSAELNDAIILQGTYLDSITKLQFSNNHIELPIEIDSEPGGTASEVIAKISKQSENDFSLWPAGLYAVRGIFSREGLELTTNEVAMPLAPKINIKPRKVARGQVTLKLSVTPNIFPDQNVILLFGDQQIPAGPQSSSTGTITFAFDVANPGTYLVRLRVDGVDSIPMDPKATTPSFADNQKVTVT